MKHKTNIVRKPWGYEYLVYQNENVALWLLYLMNNQTTSLHCHPKKTTGLIVIDGIVETSFFNDKRTLHEKEKIMIRKGLFHSTKSLSTGGSILFEIETPVDKKDLVRFKDNYGREGLPYEDYKFEEPKYEDSLWITEPKLNKKNIYNYANSEITVISIINIEAFNDIDNDENIIFLNGGILTNDNQYVAGPGDIVICKTVKQLLTVFKNVDKKTIIMTLKK